MGCGSSEPVGRPMPVVVTAQPGIPIGSSPQMMKAQVPPPGSQGPQFVQSYPSVPPFQPPPPYAATTQPNTTVVVAGGGPAGYGRGYGYNNGGMGFAEGALVGGLIGYEMGELGGHYGGWGYGPGFADNTTIINNYNSTDVNNVTNDYYNDGDMGMGDYGGGFDAGGMDAGGGVW